MILNLVKMKKKTVRLIAQILKYLFPAIIGWLEGDSHAIADAISALLMLF